MKSLLSREPSIVKAEQSSYYYAPNLPIDRDELRQIIRTIQNELSFNGYIAGEKLVDTIYKYCPTVALNTGTLTPICVRNSLAYLLRNRFSFKNGIISPSDNELGGVVELSKRFVRMHERFTIDELKEFYDALGSGIHWDTIMRGVVRLSDTDFIRRDLIAFDTKAIDTILEEQCHGDYIPLKDISLYLSFPAIGYPWNIYVLESYLYHTSKKFRLIHNSFSQSGVYGAMVRTDCVITDYRTLIINALSASDALNSTNAALLYIVNCGLQQRATYNGIDKAVQEAKLLQEKRALEKK